MWKGAADSKKTKRLSKEEIKKQLLDSMIVNKVVKEPEEPGEAAKVIKQYEDIIKTKKKGIISIGYYQGLVFKRFKVKKKFIKLVSQIGIPKNTVTFKINALKLCEKYPKLLRSSTGLGFFKDYHKDLKQFARKMKKIFDNF